MLLIHQQQLDAFSENQKRRFIEDLCIHLRKEFPTETEHLEYKDLSAIAERTINKAEIYNITERRDICQLTNYFFIFGEEFDSNGSLAREILDDPLETSGSVKILNLNSAFIG